MMMRTRRKTKKTLEIMCSRKFFPHTPQTQVITPESYSHIPGLNVFSGTYNLSCGVSVGKLSLVLHPVALILILVVKNFKNISISKSNLTIFKLTD